MLIKFLKCELFLVPVTLVPLGPILILFTSQTIFLQRSFWNQSVLSGEKLMQWRMRTGSWQAFSLTECWILLLPGAETGLDDYYLESTKGTIWIDQQQQQNKNKKLTSARWFQTGCIIVFSPPPPRILTSSTNKLLWIKLLLKNF